MLPFLLIFNHLKHLRKFSYFLLMATNIVNHELHRLAFYIGIIMIAYISYIVKNSNQIIRRMVYIYSFLFFIVIARFIYSNYYGTINRNADHLIYKSMILGIDEGK